MPIPSQLNLQDFLQYVPNRTPMNRQLCQITKTVTGKEPDVFGLEGPPDELDRSIDKMNTSNLILSIYKWRN